MHATPLALDRSVRTVDADGRLHVAVTNISKANVCPYLGSEIPDADALGLDAAATYQLLRDPEELAKAAPTFNNVPLLSRHVPVNVNDHQPGLVVGATGTDAAFEAPFLRNSLVVWEAGAIAGIESGEQRELSSAYRYRAVMEPGEYEGVKYDGRMVEIVGNHVALVSEGRAGPDVVVGDSKLPSPEREHEPMTKVSLSRKAALAKGALAVYLRPKLAQDAKIDLTRLLAGVTAKNFAAKKAGIVAALTVATAGKLAQDADIADVVEMLDTLDSEADAALDDDVPADPVVEPVDEMSADADPLDRVSAFLKGKISDEDIARVCEMLKPMGAADEPPPTPGAPKPPTDDDDSVKRPAMDAAIAAACAAAARAAETSTIARLNGIQEARDAVAPYVGKLAIACDSAAAVYKAALDVMKVDVEGVHPSAYRAVLAAQPKPGEVNKPRVAMDAEADISAFAKLFPDAPRVKHL